MTTLHEIYKLGQSPWIDYITRSLIATGQLQQRIDQGIVGLTSNPTIWQKAFASGNDYDMDIQRLARAGMDIPQIYDEIAFSDIRHAALDFRPIYDRTGGRDGLVSLEVSPALAYDTEKTLDNAQRLSHAFDLPNVLVKIPGTPQGLIATERALTEGINVNVTLLFSLESYYQVTETYFRALEARVTAGQRIDTIASVASFFVSRVDTAVDKQLNTLIEASSDEHRKAQLQALKGKAAVANAKVIYAAYQTLYRGPRWDALAKLGAKTQRCLWGSTSTKNPDYSDVMYANQLIGIDTVDTMPPVTVDAFLDHGYAALTLDQDLEEAHAQIARIEATGISLNAVTTQLQKDGVSIFADNFNQMLAAISAKRDELEAHTQ